MSPEDLLEGVVIAALAFALLLIVFAIVLVVTS